MIDDGNGMGGGMGGDDQANGGMQMPAADDTQADTGTGDDMGQPADAGQDEGMGGGMGDDGQAKIDTGAQSDDMGAGSDMGAQQ